MQTILFNICDKNIENNLEFFEQTIELGCLKDDYVKLNSVICQIKVININNYAIELTQIKRYHVYFDNTVIELAKITDDN